MLAKFGYYPYLKTDPPFSGERVKILRVPKTHCVIQPVIKHYSPVTNKPYWTKCGEIQIVARDKLLHIYEEDLDG